MNEAIKEIVQDLKKKYFAKESDFKGQATVLIKPGSEVELLNFLRDTHHFEMLVDMTAVDYGVNNSPRFHIVYQLLSISKNIRLEIRLPIEEQEPIAESVTGVYPNANWLERELWDMFGISFTDHPDLRRILMPADWEGHPLRKDYPLGYEEVQFTFNKDEIAMRKPKPKD